jgi:hypothetical protein
MNNVYGWILTCLLFFHLNSKHMQKNPTLIRKEKEEGVGSP